MAKQSLSSLTVQALRGATQSVTIDFEKSKSLTLIYGENGTGKTTLCDALDFIANGQVGSLDGRGLGGTSGYWNSVGKTKNDISVELQTSAGKWAANCGGRGVKRVPDNDLIPKVSVLRRSQLLQLLQAAPASRYEAIRPFIDISGVEASEKELRSLILEKEKQLTQASAIIVENQAAIDAAWTDAGRPDINALAWARAECGKDMAEFEQRLTSQRSLVSALNALQQGLQKVDRAVETEQNSQQQLDLANQQYETAKAQCLEDESSTIQLLLEAQKYLSARGKVDTCPLCGSAEKAADLPDEVVRKLNALQALRQALDNRKAAERDCQQAQTILANELAHLSSAAENFAITWAAMQDQLNNEDACHSVVAPVAAAVLNDGDQLAAGLRVIDLPGAIVVVQDRLGMFEAAKARMGSLKAALQRYEQNYASLRGIEKVLPSLKRALEVLGNERRRYVDGLLHNIAKEVGTLYEKLHPGEGLGKISLTLDPVKRSSLDLGAKFLDKDDAPPHAYFSESHLDSLGLCIFLALASLQGRDQTILVLDDILGSIDEPHVDRLIHLLYEESQKFLHCIITTHYRPWKEKYRWGLLRHGQCQFIELRPWSKEKGVVHGKTSLTPVAELGQLLAADPPSPQLICGSAGVVLEGLCDYLTAHYECAVPRRKGKPTLGDLLPAIDKKLKPVLKVERKQADGTYIETDLGKLFEQLQTMPQVRNVFGCHFNELAMHLPEQDAMAFGHLVFQAADALYCVEEGWPQTEKAGAYWATRNETRRLHPLKKPS